MSLEQLQAVVSLLVGVAALGTGIGLWRRVGAMKTLTDKELRPNGGGSLVDRVLNICDWQPQINKRLEKMEHLVATNLDRLEKVDAEIERSAVRHLENVERLKRLDSGMDVMAEGQRRASDRLSDLQHDFNNLRTGKLPPEEPPGSVWRDREPEPPRSPGRF